jgi:succinate-semialdehyde dehydrogenase/glutarate-semialdehyde dehydrogenase
MVAKILRRMMFFEILRFRRTFLVRAFSMSSLSPLASLLKNPSLLVKLDDGHLQSSESTFAVYNPADPNVIVGNVPIMAREDCSRAIQDSHVALTTHWRDGTTAAHRAELLRAWAALIHDNADDMATIMTMESGKPWKESRGETDYAISFLEYYASEAIRPSGAGGGFLTPTPFFDPGSGAPRGQVLAMHQAVGVTALITPWNFPIAMVRISLYSFDDPNVLFVSNIDCNLTSFCAVMRKITRKVGPALAAGCTAIVKPSELTPITALALQALADEAGIPQGVLQTITPDTENTASVGEEFCRNPLVQKLSFTGSTAIGKMLMAQSSNTVKRLSLELGGNAPFVVFADADLDQAVTAAVASKYRHAGQTCVCADRFLVHASVHDIFVGKLKRCVQELTVGPGMEEGTTLGPLISRDAVASVDEKVQEAINEGAELVLGGSPLKRKGPSYYDPTILTNVSSDSRIWKTETFGPVAPIRPFESDEEALAIANDSNAGLAAYFCSRDLSRAFQFSKR